MKPTLKRLSTLELKGPALSILWCILDYKIVRGVDVVGTKQLVRETGYSRPSLSDGLDRLTANGYIVAYETRGQGGETIYGLSRDFPALFSGESTQTYPTLQKIFAALDGVVVKDLTDLKELNQLTQQQPATLQKFFTALPEAPSPAAPQPETPAARLLALGGSEVKITKALARRHAHGTSDATIHERIDIWLEYMSAKQFDPQNVGAFMTAVIGDWRGVPKYDRPVMQVPDPMPDEPLPAETPAELEARERAEQERVAQLAAIEAERGIDQANPAYPVLRQIQAAFARQACAERVNRLRPGGLTTDTLTLLCQPLDKDWLQIQLLGQLRSIASSALHRPINVVFQIIPQQEAR